MFFAERSQLMVIDLDRRRAAPEVSRPRKLLDGPYVWERFGNFDITPDGRRFVFVRRSEGADQLVTLRVLLNWTAPRQNGAR